MTQITHKIDGILASSLSWRRMCYQSVVPEISVSTCRVNTSRLSVSRAAELRCRRVHRSAVMRAHSAYGVSTKHHLPVLTWVTHWKSYVHPWIWALMMPSEKNVNLWIKPTFSHLLMESEDSLWFSLPLRCPPQGGSIMVRHAFPTAIDDVTWMTQIAKLFPWTHFSVHLF